MASSKKNGKVKTRKVKKGKGKASLKSNRVRNVVIGITVAGIVLALSGTVSAAGSRINELQADLTIETSGRIHKVDFSSVTLAVDVTVKNPSRTAVTFRHPFVKLKSQGKDLLTSELNQTLYPVASYGFQKFTIYFKSSIPAIAMMAPALANEYKSKGTVTLEVYTKTEITAIGSVALDPKYYIPFPKTEMMTFGKQANS